MKNKLYYEAPEAFVEDLNVEGVLCTSGNEIKSENVDDLGNGGEVEL